MTNFLQQLDTDTDNCKSAIYSSTKTNCSVAWLYDVQWDYNLSEMGFLLNFVSNQYVFGNWSKLNVVKLFKRVQIAKLKHFVGVLSRLCFVHFCCRIYCLL